LELRAGAGADTSRPGATGAPAVGVTEALAGDKLRAMTITDVLRTGGVERWYGVCNKDDCKERLSAAGYRHGQNSGLCGLQLKRAATMKTLILGVCLEVGDLWKF
jgi:hypothetical protein